MVETSGDQGMRVVDLRFESLRDLQEDFGPFLSPAGFFLRDTSDFAVSDVLRFRLMLPGDFVLIEGTGVVVWVRSPAETTQTLPFGVAVGFATLSDQGRELVERIVNSHIEGGGRPFDMSRPAENGDLQAPQPDEDETPGASGQQDKMRFTVREDPTPGLDDEAVVDDAEQRLPFEEATELELDEDGVDGGVELVSEPLMSQRDDDDADEVIGADTREGPEMQEDVDQAVFAVEMPEPLVQESEPVFLEPSDSMEVSMLEDQDSMPDRQASWEHGEEEPDSLSQPEKKGRSALVWTVVGVAVLVTAAWVLWTQYPEYLPWDVSSPGGVTAGVDHRAEEASPSVPIPPLSDEDLEAAVEAAVDAVTVLDQVESPEPEPTEVIVSGDAVSGPGHKIVDIRADEGERGTVILIRADGSIESGRIRTSILASPPRILVRISGIESLYRPIEIPVGTSEVRGIRIGHHPETHPPSLWIVMDRVDEDVVAQDVEVSGNAIRIEVGR